MTKVEHISDDKCKGFAKRFVESGYVVIRNAFSHAEVEILKRCVDTCDVMQDRFRDVQQKFEAGEYPSFETIFVWNDTSGFDVFSYFSRRAVIFNTIKYAFDDEPYVYHNKVALKYPKMPGFSYHQDYYYWYGMGCLYPDMATCFIAAERSELSNGCLRVLDKSHRLGRVEHESFGPADSGVERDRLTEIMKRHPEVAIELDPGDCVIFHANTIHGSYPNKSALSRIGLLACYNTKRNDPYITDHEHPNYIPQIPLDDRVTADMAHRLPDFQAQYYDAVSKSLKPRWADPV